MVDLKHLTEKGNKRCIIGKNRYRLGIQKPLCVGKNNQCNNQLRRQKCKEIWNKAIDIANKNGVLKGIEYLKNTENEMLGWF